MEIVRKTNLTVSATVFAENFRQNANRMKNPCGSTTCAAQFSAEGELNAKQRQPAAVANAFLRLFERHRLFDAKRAYNITNTFKEGKMKIVFCGGGTAGHVMPNIALAQQLQEDQLHYVGTDLACDYLGGLF